MPQSLRILFVLLTMVSLPTLAQDINAAEAHQAVKSGKLTLIDIRTPPEWKQPVLPKVPH